MSFYCEKLNCFYNFLTLCIPSGMDQLLQWEKYLHVCFSIFIVIMPILEFNHQNWLIEAAILQLWNFSAYLCIMYYSLTDLWTSLYITLPKYITWNYDFSVTFFTEFGKKTLFFLRKPQWKHTCLSFHKNIQGLFNFLR